MQYVAKQLSKRKVHFDILCILKTAATDKVF